MVNRSMLVLLLILLFFELNNELVMKQGILWPRYFAQHPILPCANLPEI